MTENEKMDPQSPGSSGEVTPAAASSAPSPEAELLGGGQDLAASAPEASGEVAETGASKEVAEGTPGEEGAAKEEGAAPANERMQWYIIHSYSGFENKVKESLRQRADAYGMGDKIGEILVPTEDVVEVRDGKKRNVKKKFFPGYVLVQMEMSDEAWHAVRSTPKVTGFVGGGQRPLPMSQEEVDRILSQVHVTKDKPKPKIDYKVGETVRITDGPFSNFTGVVEETNEDRSTLKVMVSIFGRATPVELEFHQVKRPD